MFDVKLELKANADLTDQDRREMWRLYGPHHNVTEEEFFARSRTGVEQIMLFRHARRGALVGFTGLRRWRAPLPGGRAALAFYVGQSFIDEAYRGHDLIQRTVIRTMLGPWLAHPLEPVYFWSDCISYKPYLLAARNLKVFYPSPDWDTPPDVRALIDALGARYYPDEYDPARGTVLKKQNRLREHVAPITEQALRDRHIRFYATMNEGHARGDGLIAVYPATLENLAFFLGRRVQQAARRLRGVHVRRGRP
jgi:hypothetical protein